MCRRNLGGIVFSLLAVVPTIDAAGQKDTISVKKHNLLTSYIKEGTSQFLSFTQDEKTKAITAYSIQERTVKFGNRNGLPVIIVIQHRHLNDSTMSKYVYTVSDRQNFQTIYDYTYRIVSGIEAYSYTDRSVAGADSVKNNTKNKFIYNFDGGPPYCAELNVETVCALPIRRTGQKFKVPFYEPGLDYPAEYHDVAITGTERLQTVNRGFIDCWVVRIAYDKDSHDDFWISRSRHEFLKLESHSPGLFFSRVKLFNSDVNRFFN